MNRWNLQDCPSGKRQLLPNEVLLHNQEGVRIDDGEKKVRNFTLKWFLIKLFFFLKKKTNLTVNESFKNVVYFKLDILLKWLKDLI
jgi:hypothetical protein